MKRQPEPPPPALDPPGHLSDRSQRLWLDCVPRRARSPGRLALLQASLEALDLADRARLKVEEEGMTKTTEKTGAVHVHPLLKVATEARRQFMSGWEKLGLTWDPTIDGRVG
jgi:phage terminase small subunit